MKKCYYLKSCDTCKRILKEWNLPNNVVLHDIKTVSITVKQLHDMKALAGSYEALFSKRAKLYKERELKNKNLVEQDYKNLILEHYTFLKRPVLVYNRKIYIGNSKKTITLAKQLLENE